LKSILSERCPVLENSRYASDIYLLRLKSSRISEHADPGQFVNVLVRDRPDIVLRRPFSILDCTPGESIELLIRIKGPGSSAISRSSVGEEIDLIGPMGSPFQISDYHNNHMLIAGGIGIVPIFFLLKKMFAKGVKPVLFYGAKSADMLVLLERIDKMSLQVDYCTEDGSFGYCGLVTSCAFKVMKSTVKRADKDVESRGNRKTAIYACGPREMLKDVVGRFGRGKNVQICLEEMMACGVGACHSCVVRSREDKGQKKYLLVCKDGPVFFTDEVDID
jgi:dihydroorotate dehydrogenase electron transfer subunit